MSGALDGLRVLVVEDEPLVAMDIAAVLRRAGAAVLGPAHRLDAALALAAEEVLDGALLDINLHGQHVFPVADALAAREVPFVFTTGYDRVAIPESYADVPLCSKPTDALRLAQSLAEELTR